MPLTKKPLREKRPVPVSFRMSETVKQRLEILSEAFNRTQVEIIEQLVDDAFNHVDRKMKAELARIESARKRRGR